MVHGETGTREEVQQPAVLLVRKEAALVSQCSGVSHVDRDGVSVAEGCGRGELHGISLSLGIEVGIHAS